MVVVLGDLGTRRGEQVNGVPTPTLDAFLNVVKHIGDKSPARVKTVSEGVELSLNCAEFVRPVFRAYAPRVVDGEGGGGVLS